MSGEPFPFGFLVSAAVIATLTGCGVLDERRCSPGLHYRGDGTCQGFDSNFRWRIEAPRGSYLGLVGKLERGEHP